MVHLSCPQTMVMLVQKTLKCQGIVPKVRELREKSNQGKLVLLTTFATSWLHYCLVGHLVLLFLKHLLFSFRNHCECIHIICNGIFSVLVSLTTCRMLVTKTWLLRQKCEELSWNFTMSGSLLLVSVKYNLLIFLNMSSVIEKFDNYYWMFCNRISI